ncbi:MAG: AccI family restriction endonuclease [Chloroflexi bacterium]|nr:AccI family restriction endonuclease [Chloroflexota bacterium]
MGDTPILPRKDRQRGSAPLDTPFSATCYGPSGVAPTDVREFELYFERLEAAGLGNIKRPDILVFRKTDANFVSDIVEKLGGDKELPFIPENNKGMRALLSRTIVGVECENSLWVAKQMPNYGTPLSPQKRLGGKPGLKKTAVVPTIILKDEDLASLQSWQTATGVPIHVWHVFHDIAYGISLDNALTLLDSSLIKATEQIFQAPGGATTRKQIYKIYYHYGYKLAETQGEVKLKADSIVDKNGHILPFVRFEGGELKLSNEALQELQACTERRR